MLADALLQQYPGIVIGPWEGAECCVTQPANGPAVISHWARPEPKPVEAEVLAAFNPLPAAKAAAIAANRAEAAARIGARWPTWRQLNLADGTYPDTEAQRAQMVADKQAVIAAENAAADSIEACMTVEQVAAVVVNWPVI